MKALSFEGSGNEYFKIWMVNVFLTIVTLGLYYPWAKVRNHRYFYANTTLEGRNFEYHATGKQLFLGFLVAMALFIIYIVIQQVSPLGSLVLIAVLFLGVPWLIWRSMKFRMRMTSYSNVRFGFEGKLGQSYINFFVYPLILLLAIYGVPLLGFLLGSKANSTSWITGILPLLTMVGFVFAFYMYALIKKKNTTYMINGSRYGQGEFFTDVQTRKFALIALKTIGMGIFIMGVMALVIGVMVSATVGMESLMELKEAAKDPVVMQEKMGEIMPIIGLAYLGLILGSMAIIAYATTRQRSYVYDNTTLDDKITFASTLQARPYAWVMISNFVLVILTLGLAFPWAKVRMARLMLENTLVDTEAGFYEYLTQRQNEESSLGEQIGDAFDVDVGLGF